MKNPYRSRHLMLAGCCTSTLGLCIPEGYESDGKFGWQKLLFAGCGVSVDRILSYCFN